MKSIVEQIFDYAFLHPGKKALISGNREVLYRDLSLKILNAQRILKGQFNLKPGDRIILAASKEAGFVYTYFAAHLSGIIVVPVDTGTSQNRFDFIVEKTQPVLVVGFRAEGAASFIDFSVFESEGLVDCGELSFPGKDSIADIVFTTGTTGEPQGVVLTHKNIAAAAFNINTFIGNTEEDTELLALPISHSFGLGRLRCVLSKGGTLVLLGSFVNVKRFYRFMKEYKISGLALVPSSWAFLKKMSGLCLGEYSDQLHYIEIGSAPMLLEEKRILMELLPHTNICMHYGLTEASRSAFIEFHAESEKLDTVGKATPHVMINIKNEGGVDVPFGNEGEICIKGDSVTSGYWNNELNNGQFFWGDYFRTGDWGVIDKDGYLLLKSRKKELINVGGKKVSPIEVETILLQQDGVSECACIGIADPNQILGEVVKAFLVKDPGSNVTIDEIRENLNGKLEAYKLPVEYEWIDVIPKTVSGKIQRLLLKR